MKYVNKATRTLTKERFIPGGFPMCSLFYFCHMFTLVKHIIQTGAPLSSWPGRGRLGVRLSHKNTGDIPQRSHGSQFSFMKLWLPETDNSERRCAETSVRAARRAERVKTPKRSGRRLFAGSDPAARSVRTDPLARVVTSEVKSLAGGAPSSVEEREWNALSHFSTWTAPGSVTRKRTAQKWRTWVGSQ